MLMQHLINLKNVTEELRKQAPELPIQQLHILLAVALDEGTTARSLEKLLSMTQASVGRNVTGLTRIGWVETRQDPRDARAKPIYLTTAGRELLEAALRHLG